MTDRSGGPPKNSSRIEIGLEDPTTPDVAELIEALDRYQKPLYPLESHHGLDLADLIAPHIRFFVARVDGQALGCCGVKLFEAYGEVSRLFVSSDARGLGLARQLMARIEVEARAHGLQWMRLETGVRQPEAIGLYQALGYKDCPPFGSYKPDPNSCFMEKRL